MASHDSIANLLLKITSDGDDAERGLNDLSQQLKLFDGEEATAEAKVDKDPGQRVLDQMRKALEDFGTQVATATADVDAGGARVNLAELNQEVSALDGKTATVNVKTRGFGEAGTLLSSFTSLLKPSVFITLVGFAAQGVGLLGGAFAALAAGIAPAAGAMAAFPSLMSAVAQGAIVAKLGMTGFGDSFKGFGDAFKAQTPAARNFAGFLKGFIPDLVHLRNLAQGPILRGLTDGIRSAAGNFGVLNPIVRRTANSLGEVAREAGAFVGGRAFGKDLATIGNRNADIIRILGKALIDVAKAFTDIIVAAGPLTTWLAKTAAGWAHNAAVATQAGRETGKLGDFFERTRIVLQHLFSILGSLAGILGAVGKAGFGLGIDLLRGADTGAAALDKLANSAKGQTALKQFFDDLRPSIREAGLLIRDIGIALAELATQPGLTQLLNTLRTQLLPILVQVIGSTTKAFGPVLVEATANFTRFLQPLLGASGPLTQFVRLLGGIAGVLADIMGAVPGANAAFATIIGGAATFKAAMLLGKFTGITTAVEGLRALRVAEEGTAAAAVRTRVELIAAGVAAKVQAAATAIATAAVTAYTAIMNGSALAAVRARVATIAVTGVLAAQTAATTLATAASVGFAAVMAVITSPIFLVVAAITALIAIGYLLVKNWDTVSAAASAVWEFIKDAIVQATNQTVALIVGAWHLVAGTLSAVWNVISSAASSVWNAIKSVIGGAASGAASAVSSVFNALADTVSSIWGGIKSAASSAWNAVKGVISDAVNGALSLVRNIAGDFLSAGRSIVDKIGDGISAGAGAVKSAVSSVVRKGVDAVSDLAGSFKSAGESIVNAIKDGILSAANAVYDAVKSVVRKAKDLLPGSEPKDPRSPLRNLSRSGQAIVENLAAGIPRGADKLTQVLTAQLSALPITNIAPVVAPTAGPSYYNINRTYNLPPGPGGGLEPTFAAAQLDNLLRDEGAYR